MSVQWSRELEELHQWMRIIPEELTGEASHIMEDAANGAAVAVKQVYGQHRVTGKLQNGVSVSHFFKGKFIAYAIVKSASPIAWLFDNGSQARHWASGKSTGTMWGKTPPTHIFVKTAIHFRRRGYEACKELLVRKGFQVSGDA